MSQLIDDILSYKISDIIGKFVSLKNAGVGQKKCCCPFHHEKTPSFMVNDKKNMYHCFGCGASGNSITFIKQIKNISSSQAVDYLCDMLNIDKSKYKEYTPETKKQKDENEIFFKTMDTIASYYQECLQKDKDAFNYVKKTRKINDNTEKEFLFGLADNNLENLLNYCKIRDISEELLIKYGIIREKEDQNNKENKYLFFRNRIMIPIHNEQGRIVAFGGRIYKTNDKNAKYLNSGENDFFKKGNILFNFNRAKNNIGKNKNNIYQPLIIVEGYMDAITLWQYGFKTAVAPLGTSITENHLKKIFNYCQEPIFVFDNDNAGKKATIRACEIIFSMLKTGIVPRICMLQGAKDVDEFLKKNKAEDLQKQFNESKKINQFIFDINTEDINFSEPNTLSSIQEKIYNMTNEIPDKILKNNYKNYFYENFFLKKKENFEKHLSRKKKYSCITPSTNTVEYVEKQIISVLLKYKDLQDDFKINEYITTYLSKDNQKLLANLNKTTEDEKQEFYKNYIKKYTSDINCRKIFNDLVIKHKTIKIKDINLQKNKKKQEYKKIILEKKKTFSNFN